MSSSPVGLSSLVERVRRGEIAALGTLYESEAPSLLALALRLTADRQAAEAVVHEVFCTLWRNPDAVGRDVRDYLVRSTLKVVEAATALRRRKRVVSRVRRREEPSDLRSRE
jgi:DNA-directed RNA polymerase specialized sigma24 family protein